MKKVILVLFALAFFIELWVFASVDAAGTSAECPAGDLYCQWWTPADQAHKIQVQTVWMLESQYRLDPCDALCVDAYDLEGHGVLGAIARRYDLPRTELVRAYRGYWNVRAQGVGVIGQTADFCEWLNDFTDKLRANHPYKIQGDSCRLSPDFGG